MNCEDSICWKTNKIGWKTWNVSVVSRKEGMQPGKIYCLVLFISLQQLENTGVISIYFFFLLEHEMCCLTLLPILKWNKQPHPHVLRDKFTIENLISPAFLEFYIPFSNDFFSFFLLPYAGPPLISLVELLHLEKLHFPSHGGMNKCLRTFPSLSFKMRVNKFSSDFLTRPPS